MSTHQEDNLSFNKLFSYHKERRFVTVHSYMTFARHQELTDSYLRLPYGLLISMSTRHVGHLLFRSMCIKIHFLQTINRNIYVSMSAKHLPMYSYKTVHAETDTCKSACTLYYLTCVHAFGNSGGVVDIAFADITDQFCLQLTGADDDIWRVSRQVLHLFLPPRL